MIEVREMINTTDLSKIYHDWLQEEINFSTVDNNAIRVDTPFYDRHNDSLILYVIPQENANLIVTDGGYTLDDLEAEGISVTRSKKRKKIFLDQLTSYGVSYDENNNFLFINSNVEKFPNDKHRLLQAMLFTNDLFLTENKRTKSLFLEDVESCFEQHDIRAIEGASFIGSTGLTHKYEFSIAGSVKRNIPDKLIKVLNSPRNEMYAKVLATDVKYTRNVVKQDTYFYTFINNQEKEIASPILSLMEKEEIKVIPFSEREHFVTELGA